MAVDLQKVVVAILPILLIIIWQYVKRAHTYPRNLPYPPGPKPLPLLGNLKDVPTGAQWLGYNELSKKYGTSLLYIFPRDIRLTYAHVSGDVLYLQILGQPMVVLGSAQAAFELLEKRSAQYSDRPNAAMLGL